MPPIVNRIPLDEHIEVRTYSDGSIVLFNAPNKHYIELSAVLVTMLKYIVSNQWLIRGWHSPQCIEKSLCILADRTAWQNRWPKHCKLCGGMGCYWISGSYNEPGFYDPCFCTENGTCPRCGASFALNASAEGPCRHCGWNYNDSMPDVPECSCGDLSREEGEPVYA